MHSLAVISAQAESSEPVYSDTGSGFVQPGRVAATLPTFRSGDAGGGTERGLTPRLRLTCAH